MLIWLSQASAISRDSDVRYGRRGQRFVAEWWWLVVELNRGWRCCVHAAFRKQCAFQERNALERSKVDYWIKYYDKILKQFLNESKGAYIRIACFSFEKKINNIFEKKWFFSVLKNLTDRYTAIKLLYVIKLLYKLYVGTYYGHNREWTCWLQSIFNEQGYKKYPLSVSIKKLEWNWKCRYLWYY